MITGETYRPADEPIWIVLSGHEWTWTSSDVQHTRPQKAMLEGLRDCSDHESRVEPPHILWGIETGRSAYIRTWSIERVVLATAVVNRKIMSIMPILIGSSPVLGRLGFLSFIHCDFPSQAGKAQAQRIFCIMHFHWSSQSHNIVCLQRHQWKGWHVYGHSLRLCIIDSQRLGTVLLLDHHWYIATGKWCSLARTSPE